MQEEDKKIKPAKLFRFDEFHTVQEYYYDYEAPRIESKYHKNKFREYINICLRKKQLRLAGKMLDELYIFISDVYSHEKYLDIIGDYKIKSNGKTIPIVKKKYDVFFICELIDYFLNSKRKKITSPTSAEYEDYIKNYIKKYNLKHSNISNPISKVNKRLSFYNKSLRGGKNIKLKKTKKNKKNKK